MDNHDTHLLRFLALLLGLTLYSFSTSSISEELNISSSNYADMVAACSAATGGGCSQVKASGSNSSYAYGHCKNQNTGSICTAYPYKAWYVTNSGGFFCPEGQEPDENKICGTPQITEPPFTDNNQNDVDDSTEPPAPDISTCNAEYIAFSADDIIGETTKTAPDGCQYVPSSEGPYICEYNTNGDVQQCYAPAIPVGTVPPPSGTSCNSLYCVQPNEQTEFQPNEEIEIYFGSNPSPTHPEDYQPPSSGGSNNHPSAGGGDTGGGSTGGGDTGGGDTGGGSTGGGDTGGGSTGGGSTGGGSTGGGDTGGGDGDGDGTDEETSTFCEYAPIICNLADWFMDDSDLPENEETPFEEVEQPDSWQITGQTYCPQNFTIEIMQGKGTTLVWEPYCELGALMKPFILAVSIFASGMILLGVKS